METLDLYARYLWERRGMKLIVAAEKQGFCTYQISPRESAYIQDIYVEPDFRQYGVASDLANEVAALAREAGCKYLVGSCDTKTAGATESMLAMLKYGLKVFTVDGSVIWLRKDL